MQSSYGQRDERKDAQDLRGACDAFAVAMETLIVDVLNTDEVRTAMTLQAQAVKPRDRAYKLAQEQCFHEFGTPIEPTTSQIVAPIEAVKVVTEVLDNTMHNILQELFHSELEVELAKVPRRKAFASVT